MPDDPFQKQIDEALKTAAPISPAEPPKGDVTQPAQPNPPPISGPATLPPLADNPLTSLVDQLKAVDIPSTGESVVVPQTTEPPKPEKPKEPSMIVPPPPVPKAEVAPPAPMPSVAPPVTTPPKAPTSTEEIKNDKPPKPMGKKRSVSAAAIFIPILLLATTIPIAVYYMSIRQQSTEIRSRAAEDWAANFPGRICNVVYISANKRIAEGSVPGYAAKETVRQAAQNAGATFKAVDVTDRQLTADDVTGVEMIVIGEVGMQSGERIILLQKHLVNLKLRSSVNGTITVHTSLPQEITADGKMANGLARHPNSSKVSSITSRVRLKKSTTQIAASIIWMLPKKHLQRFPGSMD